MAFLKLYAFAALAFFPIDILWIGFIGNSIYKKQIGHLMAEQTDWLAAGLFYPLFLAGVVYFVVIPSLDGTATDVLLRGAFFGLITYATFELTSKAVLATWPWPVVFIDMLWGMVLCAATSWFSWYFGR
jgi:uncharacterized membrane protein